MTISGMNVQTPANRLSLFLGIINRYWSSTSRLIFLVKYHWPHLTPKLCCSECRIILIHLLGIKPSTFHKYIVSISLVSFHEALPTRQDLPYYIYFIILGVTWPSKINKKITWICEWRHRGPWKIALGALYICHITLDFAIMIYNIRS